MEEKLKSECARVESVRKEGNEQLRSSKAEIKSLTDKIERCVATPTRHSLLWVWPVLCIMQNFILE